MLSIFTILVFAEQARQMIISYFSACILCTAVRLNHSNLTWSATKRKWTQYALQSCVRSSDVAFYILL